MNKLHVEKKLENQTDVNFLVSIHLKERKDIKCKNKDKEPKHIFVVSRFNISYFLLSIF